MGKMPTSTFVFLDTNILFRVVTQGREGCELEHLRELSRYVEDSTISLLMPELVLLELEKQYRMFDNTVAVNLAKVEKHVSNQPEKEKVWNELGDISSYLTEKLKEWKREKIENAQQRHDEIQGLIRSERAIPLAFDNETWLRAKRRIWAGRVANIDNRSEADCCMLESLVRFFEGRGLNAQLLFCTENVRDFCIVLEGENLAIHPLMRKGLPPTQVFKDVASLVGFVRNHKTVEEPAPEELNEAFEREKSRQIEEEAKRALVDDILRSRTMAEATESLKPLSLDLSVYGLMQKSMKALMPDLSVYRLMQESMKALMPDLSLYRSMHDAMKAAKPDLSVVRGAGQEIAESETPAQQPAPEESDADGSPPEQRSAGA